MKKTAGMREKACPLVLFANMRYNIHIPLAED